MSLSAITATSKPILGLTFRSGDGAPVLLRTRDCSMFGGTFPIGRGISAHTIL